MNIPVDPLRPVQAGPLDLTMQQPSIAHAQARAQAQIQIQRYRPYLYLYLYLYRHVERLNVLRTWRRAQVGHARCHGRGIWDIWRVGNQHGTCTRRMAALDRLRSGLGGRQGCVRREAPVQRSERRDGARRAGVNSRHTYVWYVCMYSRHYTHTYIRVCVGSK